MSDTHTAYINFGLLVSFKDDKTYELKEQALTALEQMIRCSPSEIDDATVTDIESIDDE